MSQSREGTRDPIIAGESKGSSPNSGLQSRMHRMTAGVGRRILCLGFKSQPFQMSVLL